MNFIQSIKDALANPKSQRGMNGKITVDRSVLIGLLQITETLDDANRNNHDTARLDYLDQLNAEFNKRNSSNYGWRIEWNHNRIALVDSCPKQRTVREAIDEHSMRKNQ